MNWLDIVGHENNIKLLKGMLDKDAVPTPYYLLALRGSANFN